MAYDVKTLLAMSQQQLDQLELDQETKRYETEKSAREQSDPTGQREQLAFLNRLKELAQLQQGLNEKLQELDAELRAARTAGSARLVMARCGLARVQAVSRHASVGVVISADADAVWVSTFQDANGNGVRSAEIRDGTDVPVDRPSVLVAAGAGIEIALNDPTTPVRPGDRVLLSFAPSGTASSAPGADFGFLSLFKSFLKVSFIDFYC